jgi:hypothetical protein
MTRPLTQDDKRKRHIVRRLIEEAKKHGIAAMDARAALYLRGCCCAVWSGVLVVKRAEESDYTERLNRVADLSRELRGLVEGMDDFTFGLRAGAVDMETEDRGAAFKATMLNGLRKLDRPVSMPPTRRGRKGLGMYDSVCAMMAGVVAARLEVEEVDRYGRTNPSVVSIVRVLMEDAPDEMRRDQDSDGRDEIASSIRRGRQARGRH